jgi:hypothetical protein
MRRVSFADLYGEISKRMAAARGNRRRKKIRALQPYSGGNEAHGRQGNSRAKNSGVARGQGDDEAAVIAAQAAASAAADGEEEREWQERRLMEYLSSTQFPS